AIIRHSLAELALRRSERANSPLMRKKLLRECISTAAELKSLTPVSAYPYHTLIKALTQELGDLFEEDANERQIGDKLTMVEETIEESKQLFPDDEFILSAEADFNEFIKKHPKAKRALEEAFRTNRRSAYVS